MLLVRTILLVVSVFGITPLASGDTIQNFEFVDATTLSPDVSLSPGGTLEGTFSVDVTALPPLGGSINLSAIDITISPPATGSLPPPQSFTDQTQAFLTYESDGFDDNILGVHLVRWVLSAHGVFFSPDLGFYSADLEMMFASLPGTFTGGQLIFPGDFVLGSGYGPATDTLAVDPRVLELGSAPEPGTIVLMAVGIAALGIALPKRDTPAVSAE